MVVWVSWMHPLNSAWYKYLHLWFLLLVDMLGKQGMVGTVGMRGKQGKQSMLDVMDLLGLVQMTVSSVQLKNFLNYWKMSPQQVRAILVRIKI